MNQKLLLGSTALVSAGVLMAGPALAQDFEVTLQGYTEFGTRLAEDNILPTQGGNPSGGTGDRGFGFFMDTEIHFLAEGTTDSGITYGSKVELEVYSGSGLGSDGTSADEAGVFFSGGFGRIEAGRDDGVEDVMFLGGADVQSGTGGTDGDTANLTQPEIQDSGDSAKVAYFTPRIAGFQLGASYGDPGDDGGADDNGNFGNGVGVGGNWVGAFGGLETTLSAVGYFADGESGGTPGTADFFRNNDISNYAVGGVINFAGFGFGATWGQQTDFNEGDIVNIGLQYGFGPASASVGWNYFSPDAGEDQNVYAVSGDIGILPGVVLKGDYTYNDETELRDGSFAGTSAGVITVQVNY